MDRQISKEEWVTLEKGSPQLLAHHACAEDVLRGDNSYNINKLPLRDPDNFVSGGLHNQVAEWRKILSSGVQDKEILTYIENGVDVKSFFKHFKGNFKGRSYDSDVPPRQYFPNSGSCKAFTSFIVTELLDRIRNGSIRVWGKVGECDMPKVIMPLTVEPSKPRLCHDDRYLNLWTKDVPFKLETLKDAHRLIDKDACMITCDEKSGYDQVRLTEESQTYFGVQFGGWIMSYTTLPFGWKASPYIFQSIGMRVTSYLRSFGMRTMQYIDDRMATESKSVNEHSDGCLSNTILSGEAVAYCLVEVLTRLGYTLSLKKCSLKPSTCIRFLGFLADSVKQAYILPLDKKEKFIALRESILSKTEVDLRTLQRFVGKCVSMGLAVPMARLYCREMNAAISYCQKNSRNIKISGDLQCEIESWRFLDTWTGVAKWRSEYHEQIVLATDASLFKYGVAILSGQDSGTTFSDFWASDDNRPIHLKEAEAVLRALSSMDSRIIDTRVDILTDNMAVIQSFENQGGKCQALNKIMKQIFTFGCSHNIDLHLRYVPTSLNEADAPSRHLSLADSMLAETTWALLERQFGPHTVDLMALDSNAMRSSDGTLLKHFTPGPSPFLAGVNVFSQTISTETNPYVFPPISMIFPLLCLLKEQRVRMCTVVAHRFRTVLRSGSQSYKLIVKSRFCLGRKELKVSLRFLLKRVFCLMVWD